jgi:hypothetical protein
MRAISRADLPARSANTGSSLLRVKQAWPSIFPFPNLILYD